MNNMLRRARRFLIGATVYGVLERPTFAVCLWVVHLEPHLLDNMGPLTRDTAVRRGVSLTRGLPRTFVGLACDTEDWAVYVFIVQRGHVRLYRSHRSDRYFERLTCFYVALATLASVSLFV